MSEGWAIETGRGYLHEEAFSRTREGAIDEFLLAMGLITRRSSAAERDRCWERLRRRGFKSVRVRITEMEKIT